MTEPSHAETSSRLLQSQLLSRRTTYRIGGLADLMLEAETEGDLIASAMWAHEQGVPWAVLGGGSNVLVADQGHRGLVIVNRSAAVGHTDVLVRQSWRTGQGDELSVQFASCVPLSRLARCSVDLGWAGLEWALGIPGTLGGAISGNAGAYGGCMSDVLRSVRVLTQDGELLELSSDRIALSYRSSAFRDDRRLDLRQAIILSAKLSFRRGRKERLADFGAGCLARRREKQPIGLSAGSVFRNPAGDAAGRLLEASGMKGEQRGGAHVSHKHANFIINRGQASAGDVRELMNLGRRRVFERFGIVLMPELVFFGDWGQRPVLEPVGGD